DAMGRSIREIGARVFRVRFADVLSASDARDLRIRPDRRDEWTSALEALKAAAAWPDAIVVSPSALSTTSAADDPHDAFYTVLHLAQAFTDCATESSMSVTIVTTDLAAVDDRPTRPTHSTATGALRVIAQELPWLSRRSIDVASNAPANAIAPAIVREVIA